MCCGGRNHRREVLKEGAKNLRELKINCLVYNTLNIDTKTCHTWRLWHTCSGWPTCSSHFSLNLNYKASRQGVTHYFSQCVKMRLFLCGMFESTLAGSAVPHMNKSFSPADSNRRLYCAAGLAVSAEGLSRCDTAPVTIAIFLWGRKFTFPQCSHLALFPHAQLDTGAALCSLLKLTWLCLFLLVSFI